MGQQTHFFFALRLPNDTKQSLANYCRYLKGIFPFSRWVHEEDYHITLAFLGCAAPDKLERAKQNVAKTIENFHSFSLKVAEIGYFGKQDAPRIFWAGVEEEPQLFTLRNLVFAACQQAGFQLETRPFHPHITVARKWQGEAPFSQERFEKENRIPTPFPFRGAEVVLYQTHLDRVPKYEAIASFQLLVTE